MADKRVQDLTPATSVGLADLFVLEQSGQAKSLTGQILVNDLADALDGHGGISSVTYTAPTGTSLNGTLTITMADETTASFTVKNGNGISDVSSSRDGIIQTYVMTFDDGSTYTFYVSDGAGIDSITSEKTGLTTTITVDVTDGESYSFDVDDGVGISSITWVDSGTSGDGQTHTGTIHYTDGTTGSIVFRDGVKGDTGAQTYVWFKWSAAYPTADSDMSDSPNAYIGIYTGTSSTKPTAYTDYVWYEYKGEQGDPGTNIDSVELTNTTDLVDTYTITLTDGSTSTFNVTNAKSIESITSSQGQNPIPGTNNVITITFNDGDTTSFSVYNGANGLGSVSTVSGIQADGSGDVPQVISGNGAPTTATVGQTNQLYYDLNTGTLYYCAGESQGTYVWFGTGVNVDTALSSSSTNPVQNKVITARVGTGTLNTTATNLTGAVNEVLAAIPPASSTTPNADSAAGAVGVMSTWARADHRHPLPSASDVGAVDKTGDTMTDTLILKSNNLTPGTVPSSALFGSSIAFTDANGATIGLIQPTILADGRTGLRYISRRRVNNADVDNVINLYTDSSGNRSVVISDAAAWRGAIGLNGVGTVVSSDAASTSVSSGTLTQVGGAITLAAGTWQINIMVQFSSDATGYRRAFLSTDRSTSAYGIPGEDNRNAVNGAATICKINTVLELSANTTFYTMGYQNSGGSLTAWQRVRCVRIK